MNYRELLIGCGHRREKIFAPPGEPLDGWKNLYTLDIVSRCKPDFLCDLDVKHPGQYFQILPVSDKGHALFGLVESRPYHSEIFESDSFDEIHAYEVVEHLGSQGDAKAFFAFFSEIHRILKPGGYFFSTTPSRYSPWLWGDPSHRRVFIPESVVFLSQQNYIEQCDGPYKTPMSDFRELYRGDFDVIDAHDNHQSVVTALRAVKPSRWVEPK